MILNEVSPYVIPGVENVIEHKYSMEKIINIVCDYKQMPRYVVCGKSQKDCVIYVRHMLYYMIWITGAYSLEAIGEYFKKHHTVIMYGRDAIAVQLKGRGGVPYKFDVEYLMRKLDIPQSSQPIKQSTAI